MHKYLKILLATVLIITILLFIFLDGNAKALELLKVQFVALDALYHTHTSITLMCFFLLFTFINATMVPGSLPLMLLAGALFGWELGLLLCTLAGTIGSLCAYFIIKKWFADHLRSRYQKTWQQIDKQFKKHGVGYLIALRLSPGIPTNVISISMGLTSIRAQHFFWVTLIGIIPWYAIYVTAGEALMHITSLSQIVATELVVVCAGAALCIIASLWFKSKYAQIRQNQSRTK